MDNRNFNGTTDDCETCEYRAGATESNEILERAAQMKTDFLTNMSREIRTPLNAVINMAEMALQEKLPDTAASYVRHIRSSGRALLAIINDILDFSKIESGNLDITPVEYNTSSFYSEISEIFMNRLLDKGITLDLNLDPNLPATFIGDNIRLRQILINLLNNSVKFTNEGFLRISVSYETENEVRTNLKVSVEDSGIGIREEDMEKIFDSFRQADAVTTHDLESTGLGLPITKRLIELMHGELTVESTYGKGSCFTFTLPQLAVGYTPVAKVADPEKICAYSLFSDDIMSQAFTRDHERLGVFAQNLPADTDLEAFFASAPTDKEFYLFLTPSEFYRERKSFVESHPNIITVLATDRTAAKQSAQNITVIKKPLSSVSLADLYNKEQTAPVPEEDPEKPSDFFAPEAWVLIVDDNAVNLAVTEGFLEPLRMHTVTAQSGREALQRIKERHFDLVFMDHKMPEMDGIEAGHLIRRIRPDYEDVPIIALTANVMSNAREMFLASGMQDYIPKPVETRDIIEIVQRWLPDDKKVPLTNENIAKSFQPKDENEIISETPEIGDLDTKSAISMLGSEALLWNVLKEYHRTICAKAKQIREYAGTNNIDAFTVEVHALKSSSRQIGANELADMAFALETAGKENNISFILENTEPMLEKYLSYEPVLAPFFAETEESVEKAAVDTTYLKYLLSNFREAMDNLDTDTTDALCEELASYSYPENQKDFPQQIKSACDDFDFEQCAALLAQWEALL